MKKTLVFGVSTALILSTLTSCTFNLPIITKYGVNNPENPTEQTEVDEAIPDVYGSNPYSNNEGLKTIKSKPGSNEKIFVPVVYGPPTKQEEKQFIPLVYGPNTRY